MLTNLAPNHLDRYHSLEEYYGDKALLFRNAEAASVWVSNADDAAVQEMVAPVPGRHLRFSIDRRADGWYDRAGGRLMLGDRPLMPARGPAAPGRPQRRQRAGRRPRGARAPAATPRAIAAGLRTFRAIPHRVEPVREVDGVLWINDSKSTNITSTEVAVAALDRPFVLLLGGRHKGEPYTRLAEPLQGPLPRGGGVRRGRPAGGSRSR